MIASEVSGIACSDEPLAFLWQKQGKTEEAGEMLAKIYGWFTEGVDAAALKEEKALLDELNSRGKK